MSHDENNIIDVEAEEIRESDNLPAVIPPDASNSEAIELPNRQDTLLADNPERRCVATNSRGERCRKFAIYGSTVCRTHGGATKRVKEAARIRVENASNRLMGKLIEFAFDDTKPPDVQLKAIQNSLDRAGLKPPAEVVLSQGEQPSPFEQVWDSIGGRPNDALGDGDSAGNSTESFTQSDVASLGRPPTLHTQPAPEPDTLRARTCPEGSSSASADWPADEQPQPSWDGGPLGQGRSREFDREKRQQPREVHITGEFAMRLANEANRQAGVFEQRAIEDGGRGHRKYRRP